VLLFVITFIYCHCFSSFLSYFSLWPFFLSCVSSFFYPFLFFVNVLSCWCCDMLLIFQMYKNSYKMQAFKFTFIFHMQLKHEIWQSHWMAILLRSHQQQRKVRYGLVDTFYAPQWGALCCMWCPLGPCLQWWSTAHWPTLLYQQVHKLSLSQRCRLPTKEYEC
jgi:hypothetical protein